MSKWIAVLFIVGLFLSIGCATIGNGSVDPLESSLIRLSVFSAMTAEPKLVIPTYAISNTLLAVLDGSELSTLSTLEAILDAEIQKLDLIDSDRQVFLELVALIRQDIENRINLPGIDAGQKLVLVRSVIQIVRDTAYIKIKG